MKRQIIRQVLCSFVGMLVVAMLWSAFVVESKFGQVQKIEREDMSFLQPIPLPRDIRIYPEWKDTVEHHCDRKNLKSLCPPGAVPIMQYGVFIFSPPHAKT